MLDAHTLDDFEALAALWSDTNVVRHISGRPSSLQETWFRLLRYRGLWPLLGYGYWAIREKKSGRFVGDVGFADFKRDVEPSISGYPEAGWILARWSHGQGFATEAVAAALEWLDSHTDHRRVVCLIDGKNAASLRVAEKCGFREGGTVLCQSERLLLLTRDLATAAQRGC